MKNYLLILLTLGLWLVNCSLVKADKIDDLTDSCLRTWSINKKDNSHENINQLIQSELNKDTYIRFYQAHLEFIKKFESKHPYLRKDILKYHKLFNEGFIQLTKNWYISQDLLLKINKKLKNLYLKATYYE